MGSTLDLLLIKERVPLEYKGQWSNNHKLGCSSRKLNPLHFAGPRSICLIFIEFEKATEKGDESSICL